jgi:hypothetical protein
MMKEASALAEYAEESLSPLTPALDNREALLRSPENYCCFSLERIFLDYSRHFVDICLGLGVITSL